MIDHFLSFFTSDWILHNRFGQMVFIDQYELVAVIRLTLHIYQVNLTPRIELPKDQRAYYCTFLSVVRLWQGSHKLMKISTCFLVIFS